MPIAFAGQLQRFGRATSLAVRSDDSSVFGESGAVINWTRVARGGPRSSVRLQHWRQTNAEVANHGTSLTQTALRPRRSHACDDRPLKSSADNQPGPRGGRRGAARRLPDSDGTARDAAVEPRNLLAAHRSDPRLPMRCPGRIAASTCAIRRAGRSDGEGREYCRVAIPIAASSPIQASDLEYGVTVSAFS